MIYLWEEPSSFSDRRLGVYDEKKSPDRFLLFRGRKLSKDEFGKPATVEFEVSRNIMSKYDCLPNTSSIPLVNESIRNILNEIAPNEVQFLDAKLICTDGELDGYQFVNPVHMFKGIDHGRSKLDISENKRTGPFIIGFYYLEYLSGCMEPYHIARDEEYHMNLLISEKIKQAFDKVKPKLKGIRLVKPEDFYSAK